MAPSAASNLDSAAAPTPSHTDIVRARHLLFADAVLTTCRFPYGCRHGQQEKVAVRIWYSRVWASLLIGLDCPYCWLIKLRVKPGPCHCNWIYVVYSGEFELEIWMNEGVINKCLIYFFSAVPRPPTDGDWRHLWTLWTSPLERQVCIECSVCCQLPMMHQRPCGQQLGSKLECPCTAARLDCLGRDKLPCA